MIEKITLKDLDKIYTTQKEYPLLSYDKEDIACLINSGINYKNEHSYIFGYSGLLFPYIQDYFDTGYIMKYINRPELLNAFYIELLYTEKKYCNKGLQTELYSFYLNKLNDKDIYLDSLEDTVKYHEKFGFKVVKEIDDLWYDNDKYLKGIYMVKNNEL